ncbi:DUF1553 domain-containing protein [Blastopirellula marina]|uniref:Cytochrome c domain-containing protein n=1 Tax=Blastopirellula marina TaxID=124 RepID=A0A2S8F4G1_9BACT|nr:DUF1553 domain-containing protein [Blastopirellula marina]PQO27049.1 hypothetical protein C5Y98_27725 [Blastopirellula marina]PTL41196.1 DUF1553 domain-containing protein [Blastopirellula marina]
MRTFCQTLLAIGCLALSTANVTAAEAEIDFGRDIRPILSGKCFHCHGPDPETREGGLRLDQAEAASSELDSGAIAIVPGQPSESELIARIVTDDESIRMPPPEIGKSLSAAEQKLLTDWIAQGAKFAPHWSFVKPAKADLPQTSQPDWAKSPIDAFLLKRLDEVGLTPAEEADRYTLARRVSFALTGLPLSVAETDAFVNDTSPDAYEKLVDRLLAKPAYGERWTRVWLDIARYADSMGYEKDSPRTMWPYRDWVIRAINENKPFDQFSIEQLAGDLLPEASEQQIIATAFHRNTMTNTEGGTNDEEFRNAAIVDRVNTTVQAWMGLTMECAQCHTHKYDPITNQEYFEFFAIFNQTEDADRNDEAPLHRMLTDAQRQQQRRLQSQVEQAKAGLKQMLEDSTDIALSENVPNVGRFVRVENIADGAYLHIAEVQVFSGDENAAMKGKASQVSVDYDGPATKAIDGNTNGDFFGGMSTTHTKQEKNPWWEVDLGATMTIDKVVVWNRTDGDLFSRMKSCRVVILDENRQPVWAGRLNSPFNPSAEFIPPQSIDGMDEAARLELAAYLKGNSPAIEKQRKQIAELEKKLESVKPVAMPVMRELPQDKQRKSFIQIRGNYQSHGDEVEASVLDSFHAFPEGAKADRLSMARWLVDKENPLTARVVVNRHWEQLFGIGIVETSEDFGSQGELPTHPELLDYLAVELMEHDWDTKWLVKQIVMSNAFRQSAKTTPKKLELDSRNQLVSRGPRVRLSAEMVRDQALAVSGLMSSKMYGPSVQPPRPNLGLRSAFGGSTDWVTSQGEDRYRRGLYTNWRRTTPYPSMTTFDAPSREVCVIRRITTNTPLQALVTLNDPVYIEAAQAFGRVVWEQKELSLEQQVEFAVRRCLGRHPSEAETKRLVELYQTAKSRYAAMPEEARKMATDPIGPLPDGASAEELAAWTLVGNVLLNLDEALNR